MANAQNYDKKIFRLLYLLNRLDGGAKINPREAAKEFGVSIRTVQRDLGLLNLTGFPIETLEKGVHAFIKGFSLKKLTLSREEATLLSFLNEITAALDGEFAKSFQSLLRKVLSSPGESPFYIKLPSVSSELKNSPHFEALETAIQEERKISIVYQNEDGESRFKLSPFKLAYFNGFWYLLARPEGKTGVWKFRPENIRELEMLDESFDPPANLKAVLDRSVNIWFGEKPGEKVRLRVKKPVVKYFKKQVYVPLQKIVKEEKDGSLIIEGQATQAELVPIVIHWLPHLVVLSPEETAQAVETVVADYLNEIRQSGRRS